MPFGSPTMNSEDNARIWWAFMKLGAGVYIALFLAARLGIV